MLDLLFRSPPVTDPTDSPLLRFLLRPHDQLSDWASRLLDLADAWVRLAGPPLALVTAAILVGWVLVRRWRAWRLADGARMVTIHAPPEVDPGGGEALWRNLHGLLRQRRLLQGRPHLAFEYRWSVEGLTIGVWVPGMVAPRLVERAVEAAWPGARTTTTAPAMTADRAGRVRAGQLRLGRAEWFSLHTEHQTDPLRGLLGAAQERGDQEHALVQVLARPARGRRLARCRRVARALRGGQSPSRVGRLLDLVMGRTPAPSAYHLDPARAGEVRAILDKTSGPGWEVQVRYAVTTATARNPRGRLRGRAHALTAAFALYTGRNHLTRRRLHHRGRALHTRRLARGDLLSVAELAALAHLPWDRSVPGWARAGARSVAPAPATPRQGKLLGLADTGAARPVALDPADARQHLHVLGATGAGKSTLLAQLALQDAQAGRGAVVIDPKGDLVTDILARLPTRAAGKVVLLDPDEPAAPPSLNMLEGPDIDLAVDHTVEILRRVFAQWWGPRTDDILRSACLTLLHRGPATLADVPRLLTDPGFRRQATTRLRDPILRGFWDWYDQLTDAGQAQAIGPVLSRLRAFLLRRFVQRVVAQTSSSFDLRAVLDGGLLLARLPVGLLGDETSRLLGSMVVAKTWQAATARARVAEHARRDAALYIDEAHKFLNLPYRLEDLLPEARGYRLALTLSHQYLAQFPRELREAVSANARSKVAFAVSPKDARDLERHVAPELTAHDLAHLGAYHAAARLLAGGTELPACTLQTRPLPPPVRGRASQVRTAARRNFGRTDAQRHHDQVRRDLGPEAVRPPASPRAGSRGGGSRPPRSAKTQGTSSASGSPYGPDGGSDHRSPYGLGPVDDHQPNLRGQGAQRRPPRGSDSGPDLPTTAGRPSARRGGR